MRTARLAARKAVMHSFGAASRTPDSLAERAAAVLAAADPAAKVALSEALAADWRARRMPIGAASPPLRPGRPIGAAPFWRRAEAAVQPVGARGGWVARRILRAAGMRRGAIGAALIVAALLSARPAPAATALMLLRPIDLGALPLLVMQHEHLIERTAEAMGLGAVTVAWREPGNAALLAALAAGKADLAMSDLAPFLAAADAGGGTPAEIRALGAIVQQPYVLVTRNKAIRTIRDFASGDHIAVPAFKVSGPAVMLEMAAAQEWGPERYDRLDRLAVARPDAAAAAALMSGKGEIDAHFSRTPYADAELGDPAIHRVMDSFDIAGPHTLAVLATTMRFRAANAELCKAILAALQAADDYIAKTPGAAAEIFAGMSKDQDIPLEDLSDLLGDPDLAYRAAPVGVRRIASFLHRVGRLKRNPRSWRELFLPESHDLGGS